MNRILTIILSFLVSLSFASGQSPAPAKPSVFIDSEPLGARINLDGHLLIDRTPALLRGLSPGKHTVSVWKEDFIQVTQSFQTTEGQVPVVLLDLPPDSVVLAFPENGQVVDAQGSHPTTSQQFRYPTGTYALSDQGGSIRLAPVFPDEGLLTIAQVSLLAVAGAAVLSSVSDAYHATNGWIDHASQLTIGLWISTLFDLPWYQSLVTRKARFIKDAAAIATARPARLEIPQPIFDAADEALQSGQLANAEVLFSQLVREHPNSSLVPGAWFRLARIHSITGRRDLALGEYRLVAETYPQAAYYDRARQALANLYETAGDRTQALTNLDLMVLTDGFFDKADIDAQRARHLVAKEAPVAP